MVDVRMRERKKIIQQPVVTFYFLRLFIRRQRVAPDEETGREERRV